jgi:four helix bundle protein
MKENIIKEKSYSFAVEIVNLCREMKMNKTEAAIVNQLLRCGTSIAANIEEANAAISKKEFSAKISISYKEAKETQYWLRLLFETNSLSLEKYHTLASDCDEILRIAYSILKTTRMNNKE